MNGSARRFRRASALLAVISLIASAIASPIFRSAKPAPSPSQIFDPPTPPHEIVVFPQRDFVSASGYAKSDTVTVEIHSSDGNVRAMLENLVPQDDPATPEFDGIVEVNHPGGGGSQLITPDIHPTDIVRITRVGTTNDVTADQTHVANVTAGQSRPATPRL